VGDVRVYVVLESLVEADVEERNAELARGRSEDEEEVGGVIEVKEVDLEERTKALEAD
jgi:hypothetical protein